MRKALIVVTVGLVLACAGLWRLSERVNQMHEMIVKLQADVPPIAFQAAQSYEFLTLPIIERDGTETTLGVLLADLGVRSAR